MVNMDKKAIRIAKIIEKECLQSGTCIVIEGENTYRYIIMCKDMKFSIIASRTQLEVLNNFQIVRYIIGEMKIYILEKYFKY